jgi:hypothetical protein
MTNVRWRSARNGSKVLPCSYSYLIPWYWAIHKNFIPTPWNISSVSDNRMFVAIIKTACQNYDLILNQSGPHMHVKGVLSNGALIFSHIGPVLSCPIVPETFKLLDSKELSELQEKKPYQKPSILCLFTTKAWVQSQASTCKISCG